MSGKASIVFIGLGILFLLTAIVIRVNSMQVLAFDDEVLQNTEFIASEDTAPIPVVIEIPKVDISLAVTESVITNGDWKISKSGASHLANSANPGTSGNMVIYGHNKNSLFGPIRWLKKGDIIIVKNENDEEFEYEVVESYVTSPKDIEVVLPTTDEQLTLYTCTGFLDKDRHIIVAVPIKD